MAIQTIKEGKEREREGKRKEGEERRKEGRRGEKRKRKEGKEGVWTCLTPGTVHAH